jgi:hypothetical protein
MSLINDLLEYTRRRSSARSTTTLKRHVVDMQEFARASWTGARCAS